MVDGSHPAPEEQLAAVRAVIRDVGAQHIPEIVLINKADLADDLTVQRLLRTEQRSLVVSAHTGEGIEDLLARIDAELPHPEVELEVLLPYTAGALISRAHAEGEVLSEDHTSEGTVLRARVHEELAVELRRVAVPVAV